MLELRSLCLNWFLKIDAGNFLFVTYYGYFDRVLNLYPFFELLAFPFFRTSLFGTRAVTLWGFQNKEAYERYWEARIA